MYLIRSSSSACTITIAPCSRALPQHLERRAVVDADPGLAGREVGREELQRRRARPRPRRATLAIVASDGVPGEHRVEGEVGVRAPGRRPRGGARRRGCASNSCSVTWTSMNANESDRRRAAEDRGARRALRRLQPHLLALRPAAVHRLEDVRVRLDAAGEDELAGRVEHAARLGRDRARLGDVGDRLAARCRRRARRLPSGVTTRPPVMTQVDHAVRREARQDELAPTCVIRSLVLGQVGVDRAVEVACARVDRRPELRLDLVGRAGEDEARGAGTRRRRARRRAARTRACCSRSGRRRA